MAARPERKTGSILFTVVCGLTVLLAAGACLLVHRMMGDEGMIRDLLHVARGNENQALLVAGVVGELVLLIMVALGYYLSFRCKGGRRPHIRLYFLLLAIFVFPAVALVCRDPDELLHWLAVGLAAAVPIVVLIVERVIGTTMIGSGRLLYANGRHAMAARPLHIGLIFCSNNRGARHDYGMTLYELGDVVIARRYLEPLYQEEGARDEALVKALSDLAFKDKDWPAAADRLEALLAKRPSDHQVIYKLAFARAELKDYEVARDLITQIPEREQTGEMLSILDTCYRETRDLMGAMRIIERQRGSLVFKKIVERYRELLPLFPHEPLIARTVADLANKGGHTEQETVWLEDLVSLLPEEWASRRRLIDIYRERGRVDLELNHIEAIVTRRPEPSANDVIEYVHALVDQRRHEAAVTVLEEHVLRFPADRRFFLYLGRADLREGNLDDAEKHGQRALEMSSRMQSGEANALLNDVLKARVARELEQAKSDLDATPDDIDARMAYIVKLIANDKAEESVRELDSLVMHDPSLKDRIQHDIMEAIETTQHSFLILSYLSDLALQDHDYARSLELYRSMAGKSLHPEQIVGEGCRRILTLKPDYLPARVVLANFHASHREWSEVLRVMGPYFRSGGEHTPEIDKLMFEANVQLRNLPAAIGYGDRLMAHHPSLFEPLLALAGLYEENEQFQDAANALRRARGLTGDDPSTRRHLRDLEAKLRQMRFSELHHLLNSTPDDPALNNELAQFYMDDGSYMEAVKHFQFASRDGELANLANAKMALCLGRRDLLDMAQEKLGDVKLDPVGDPQADAIKGMFYEVASIFERREEIPQAFSVYKRIFLADAGYRDVAAKIEELS